MERESADPAPRSSLCDREAVNERGSVVIVTAGILTLLSLLGIGVVRVGGAAIDRARAQTSADAAALAGAGAGRSAAIEAVQRNGGVLEQWQVEGDSVEVGVRVGNAHARARARTDGPLRTISR